MSDTNLASEKFLFVVKFALHSLPNLSAVSKERFDSGVVMAVVPFSSGSSSCCSCFNSFSTLSKVLGI